MSNTLVEATLLYRKLYRLQAGQTVEDSPAMLELLAAESDPQAARFIMEYLRDLALKRGDHKLASRWDSDVERIALEDGPAADLAARRLGVAGKYEEAIALLKCAENKGVGSFWRHRLFAQRGLYELLVSNPVEAERCLIAARLEDWPGAPQADTTLVEALEAEGLANGACRDYRAWLAACS